MHELWDYICRVRRDAAVEVRHWLPNYIYENKSKTLTYLTIRNATFQCIVLTLDMSLTDPREIDFQRSNVL
jgi:hypothetical protein